MSIKSIEIAIGSAMIAWLLCIVGMAFAVDAVPIFPALGSQVIIEPGQNAEDIDRWFSTLKRYGMNFARIRLFESHMHRTAEAWDFSLYDSAFRAAERHGIHVFATIFPKCEENNLGGLKFPESESHLAAIAECVKSMVTHFRTFSALYGWVLINEPGAGGKLPENAFARQKFSEWLSQQGHQTQGRNHHTTSQFDLQRFLQDYITWYLNWLAMEVRKYDPEHDVHVNSHMIFELAAEYDFPAWRAFLTSLGASMHPSWHFAYFSRPQYALAVAANCDLVRSGAGAMPFWITELQGGNNTYSAYRAFCPTADEISQWLWLGIATGARGIILWSLNPRRRGIEAGEWALLNFQHEASDRLQASARVSGCLQQHRQLFVNARPLPTGIHLLYGRESLWIEKEVQFTPPGEENNYEGRLPGGVMKSLLAFYQLLAETGINIELQEIGEFDFTRDDYRGETIILAHQIAIPSAFWSLLQDFVGRGGTLIVEGLTAFYDQDMVCLMGPQFPLKQLLGGVLQEVKSTPGDFSVPGPGGKPNFPVHLWKSTIANTSGEVIAQDQSGVFATRNKYGRGQTVWFPSLLAMGSRRVNAQPLADFIRTELQPHFHRMPITFKRHQPLVIMKTLQVEYGYVTVITNKNKTSARIELMVQKGLHPKLIFSNRTKQRPAADVIALDAEEVAVIGWFNEKGAR